MIKNRESIQNLMPYVPGKPIDDVKREFGLTDVVKIASNENPYGASAKAIDAAKTALDDVFYYPDGSCFELKNALSKHLNVSVEQLCIGAGADEIISMLSRAFIETGDEAITGEITFGQYAAGVRAMGGSVTYIPMINGGYDLDGILHAITPKTKIIFIANPNNPTGTIITDAEKTLFLNNVSKDIMVVFDEAYQEYAEDKNYSSSVPLIMKHDNLVVLKTFSKIYGLASLRVGYAVMNEGLTKYMEKIRLPFNVSIPAQMAAIAALCDSDFLNETFRKNLDVKHYCYSMLEDMGLEYIKSETNFIMVDVKCDGMEVFDKLMRKGYIIRPGKPFGMPEHLRVTLGTMGQMEGFFDALKDILSGK